MKNFVLTLIFVFVICSCSKENKANQNKFRTLLHNTTWEDADGQFIIFTKDKLFNYKDNSGCFYFSEGKYLNIEYDGCVYSKIENVIISEDDTTFSYKQVISAGTPTGGNTGGCKGETVVLKFVLLNKTTIEVQFFYDGKFGDSYLMNKTTNIEVIGCKDATAAGVLI
jgi:hypothetical protein